MHSFTSAIIAVVLLILIVIANELGIYYENKTDEDTKSQTTAI